ncbi:MAG: hypothetical protein LPJ89_08695 [Hymenobacteraceae bacterium]|nr:hypothetical protein [Hymenobacteraceae bacterium]MDX5395261.1 hypothetical protein [Hymenobacteraceae bacterium]MDX5443843.1 hypothetical protein [Hymenobacteraceae bacterium]MDX5511299.1 hypothetical protein [Hymenobacteraceae bacterium]
MENKNQLLVFKFHEDVREQTFAINVQNLSHFFLNENDDEVTLYLHFIGNSKPLELYGGNAIEVAATLEDVYSNGEVGELVLDLFNE